ncbi:hypothetical protein GCM10010324_49460 [Streptomyces hiroshimensis]|uniref:Uncharacterized protein n=1 Tax=Streptomyces hiroshimensis TaxID=66424 RepID=A0ABQ2YW71_9ACTN|nr:hypothetical protein GCM10010324_49460 [Streptomyces hiroshimensis]
MWGRCPGGPTAEDTAAAARYQAQTGLSFMETLTLERMGEFPKLPLWDRVTQIASLSVRGS